MNYPLVKDITLFLDDKPSVFALRQKAKEALAKSGFPSNKTEAWKYTNIKNLINNSFELNTSSEPCGHDCCNHHTTNESFIEVTFCHGKLHIEEYNTPQGLVITPLPLALYENEYKNYIFNSFDIEKHPFAALNGSYLEQGICICVEKNTKINKPILIKYNQTHCENKQIHIHNLFILEKDSSIDLLEKFIGETEPYFCNIVNEIYLKENSKLNHYKIQKESQNAYHIALNAIKQQKNSSYKQVYLSLSAKLSRQETMINLCQEEASAEIYSAYRAKTNTLTDITTNINHLVAQTCSKQYAKAVLEENSTAVFQGKIHIAPNAIKTSGHQLHKALYLNDNATLNCKPELEIYADDVKCSHGATCGEIDKEQLFYLTSRGIDKTTATNMLINAHLEEILSYISNEEIKQLFFSE